MSDRREEMLRKLEVLTRDYKAQLGNRIEEITNAWQTVIATPESMTARQTLLLHVHHLAGTSGIYGLKEVSRTAFVLEEALDRQMSSEQPLTKAKILKMSQLLKALQTCSLA
jgi:chemotaxis protein histidine kinase CheA